MDHARYRELYAKLQNLDPSIPADFFSSAEYDAYWDHVDNCRECYDWGFAWEAEKAGVDIADFPCVHVAYYNEVLRRRSRRDMHPFNDPDVLIWRFDNGDFGLPVRDGGPSMVVIKHCPWCGTELKQGGGLR